MAVYLLMGCTIVHNLQDDKDITPAPVAATNLGEEMKLQAVVLQASWQSALKEGKLAAYQQ